MNLRYQVSNSFKEECKQLVGKNIKTGRIHIVGTDVDITENDSLIDFTIEDNCYVNDKFIGTTVAKKITVNILNLNNEIDLENKEIEVYTGMVINGIKEEIPFGNFIIEKPENEEVKEKTSFTGYDYMIKFNTKYENRLTYPKKLSQVLEDLCNQVGLELENTNFVNSDYMVLGNPFTDNEDRRTVLSNIAQLAGGFAKISRNNKVYIKTLNNLLRKLTVKEIDEMLVKILQTTPVNMTIRDNQKADEFIDGNSYFDDFSKNKQWGELNSLVIGLSDIEGENVSINDETSIAKNGMTEIQINDNYYLIDEAERRKVINPIWDKIKKIKYIPFKSEYYGYPYLDSGDAIYIEDTKGIKYISYVFNHTFTFNGAYSGIIETPALTKTQTAYKNKIDTKTRFRRVERKIDKINGVIKDVIEEQTETGNKLSQYKQEVDEINITVSSIEENLEENYYTKTETSSEITQKANEINIKVEEIETDMLDKASKSNLVAEFNLSVKDGDSIVNISGNKVTITADHFKLTANGELTAEAGNIGGWNISKNKLSKTITENLIYTIQDANNAMAYIRGEVIFSLDAYNYIKYDANLDKKIDVTDAVKILNIAKGQDTQSITGTVSINANSILDTIVIDCPQLNIKTSIGARGIYAPAVASEKVIANNFQLNGAMVMQVATNAGIKAYTGYPVITQSINNTVAMNWDGTYLHFYVDGVDVAQIRQKVN